MSADGIFEQTATTVRLSTLAGGRIHEGIMDHETHERYSGGDVKPYYSVVYSVPIPAAGQTTLAGGDNDTPHVMSVTLTAHAGSLDDAKRALAAGANLLRDWQPSDTSTPYSGFGAGQSSNSDGRKKPTRFDVRAHFSTYVNMGPDA